MWSATLRGLTDFIHDLYRANVPPTAVRLLQAILKDHDIYPAVHFERHCQPAPPDVFFTYHSAQSFVDVHYLVKKAFKFAAELLTGRRDDLDWKVVERMQTDGIRLWVDFMFVDQTARDIRQELDVLPRLLEQSRAHMVLGDLPLTRSWCCYEIALFNQDCATANNQELRSFIAPTRKVYFNWELTETSEEQDKTFIGERIAAEFPNGFEGFTHIMRQASASAVLSTTEENPSYPPAALDSLAEAASDWYQRTLGPTAE